MMLRPASFLGAMFLATVAYAQPVPNPVGSGIGQISIGMHRSALEERLGRRLEVSFAGDRRGGITISEPSALARLSAEKVYGTKVEAIDVLFTDEQHDLLVEMISIGVPCQAVSELRVHLSKQAKVVPVGTYAWGAETKPACRVWMRRA